MKYRLDYERLADALADRGLVDREAIRLVLQQASSTGAPFAEILVQGSLVSDWEISRVAAEVFNLPFLTTDIAPPGESVVEGLDPAYLRRHALVPLERFGDLLTVAMPAVVPTHILTAIATTETMSILPIVGTISTNRQWLATHLPDETQPPSVAVGAPEAIGIDAAESALPIEIGAEDEEWVNIFDAGDQAVQLNLRDADEDPGPPAIEL